MVERCRRWWHGRLAVEKWVIVLWVGAFVGIIVRLLVLSPGDRTLFPTYHDAGRHWAAGADLYPEQQVNPGYPLFRYSPAVAVSFAPFGLLPVKAGDICWRFVNTATLLGGLLWFARSVAPAALSRTQTAALFALMFPPALGHLSNGQCNALVIGLILIAFGAAADRRWNLSAGCMAVACLFKLYPIAAGLLLALLYPRRFGPRLLAALAVGLVLPFAFQSPNYVLRQYWLWANYAVHEDRSTWDLLGTNVDLQLLLRVWLAPVGVTTYRLIEVGAGLLFAAVCWAGLRAGRPERRLLTLALGLACVWMTVLGPATESPTYLILAPSVAWGVLSCWVQPAGLAVSALMVGSYLLFLSLQLTGWSGHLFNAFRTRGPQPVAGLIFLAALLIQEWTWRPGAGSSATPLTAREQNLRAA
jgi:hypothetical protein